MVFVATTRMTAPTTTMLRRAIPRPQSVVRMDLVARLHTIAMLSMDAQLTRLIDARREAVRATLRTHLLTQPIIVKLLLLALVSTR